MRYCELGNEKEKGLCGKPEGLTWSFLSPCETPGVPHAEEWAFMEGEQSTVVLLVGTWDIAILLNQTS